jgi:hypothetical protein
MRQDVFWGRGAQHDRGRTRSSDALGVRAAHDASDATGRRTSVAEGARLMPAPTTSHHQYDAAENIVYVTFPQVHLETAIQIREHFDRVIAFWKAHCKGKKVYYVVNYDGFTVNLRENDSYAQNMKRVADTCAITIVRYGGDSLQRTAVRLYNMKLHAPSRIYASRQEALEVVRAIKSGEMSIEDTVTRTS